MYLETPPFERINRPQQNRRFIGANPVGYSNEQLLNVLHRMGENLPGAQKEKTSEVEMR